MHLDPLIPANAGTQIAERRRRVGVALRSSSQASGISIWVPAFAGMSGIVGVRL